MKFVPISEWLPKYPRTNLRGDVIAGIALAGLLIPESMGYAGIAGLPPQAGLYATAFGLLAYAIFGTSRQLAVSPTSSSAVILAATVAPLAAASPSKFVVLASAVTLVLGLLFLVGIEVVRVFYGERPRSPQRFREQDERETDCGRRGLQPIGPSEYGKAGARQASGNHAYDIHAMGVQDENTGDEYAGYEYQ